MYYVCKLGVTLEESIKNYAQHILFNANSNI